MARSNPPPDQSSSVSAIPSSWDGPSAKIIAITAGLAVPLLIQGRGAMGAALAIALIVILLRPDRGTSLRKAVSLLPTPLGMTVVAVFVFWLISSLGSIEMARSLEKWARTGVYVGAAALLWARLSEDKESLKLALKTLVIAGLAACLFAVLSVGLWNNLVFDLRLANIPTQLPDNASVSLDVIILKAAKDLLKSFGSVSACLVPAVVAAGLFLKNRWQWASFGIIPLALGTIYLTGSKSGFLGLLGIVLVLFLWWGIRHLPRRASWVVTSITILAVLGMAATILLRLPNAPEMQKYEQAQKYYSDPEYFRIPYVIVDFHRQLIWGTTFHKFLETPWFGHGPDVINRLPRTNVKIPLVGQQYIPGHPHNWPLEVLAETGIIGFVAMAAALFLLMHRLFRGAPCVMIMAAVGLNGAFWTSGLTNFSFWSSWWMGTYLVLLALLLAAAAHKTKEA